MSLATIRVQDVVRKMYFILMTDCISSQSVDQGGGFLNAIKNVQFDLPDEDDDDDGVRSNTLLCKEGGTIKYTTRSKK